MELPDRPVPERVRTNQSTHGSYPRILLMPTIIHEFLFHGNRYSPAGLNILPPRIFGGPPQTRAARLSHFTELRILHCTFFILRRGRYLSGGGEAGESVCRGPKTNGARAEALGAGPDLVLVAASFLPTSAFIPPRLYRANAAECHQRARYPTRRLLDWPCRQSPERAY